MSCMTEWLLWPILIATNIGIIVIVLIFIISFVAKYAEGVRWRLRECKAQQQRERGYELLKQHMPLPWTKEQWKALSPDIQREILEHTAEHLEFHNFLTSILLGNANYKE